MSVQEFQNSAAIVAKIAEKMEKVEKTGNNLKEGNMSTDFHYSFSSLSLSHMHIHITFQL